MTYQQEKQYLYRLNMLAQHNQTQVPPIVEIKVPRADLKHLLRRHRDSFKFDPQDNAMLGDCRLVAI